MNLIEQYLLEPIKSGSGYNIVNTAVLAVLFYLMAMAVLVFLRKNKISIKRVSETVVPFIFLGGVVRTLEDACVYPCGWPERIFFVTPMVYLEVVGILLLLLLGEKALKRQFAFQAGWVLLVANLAIVKLKNADAVGMVIFFFLVFMLVFFAAAKTLRMKLLLEKLNAAIIGAHLFEASATFVAIDYFGYGEQHVVGGALIGLLGTGAAMVLLKAVAIPLVLYLCEGLKKDEKEFVKLLVLALGLGPGTRNFLSLVMGV